LPQILVGQVRQQRGSVHYPGEGVVAVAERIDFSDFFPVYSGVGAAVPDGAQGEVAAQSVQ
jgi:hypothetical protein